MAYRLGLLPRLFWYVCGNRLPHSFLASPLVYAIGEGSRIGYGMRFQAPLWLSVGYGLLMPLLLSFEP